MMFVAFNLLVSLLFLAGIILLQLFLSKKENKWLGLILPAITFSFSIFIILSMTLWDESLSSVQILIHFISLFFLYNIPTLILLGIYLGFRHQRKIRSQLEQMNIQDLN